MAKVFLAQSGTHKFCKKILRKISEHSHATSLTYISVPTIVRVCALCIELHGMIDGIYRLSGISSNIRALK